jgi:phosphonate degradation associated HDIG domain protein
MLSHESMKVADEIIRLYQDHGSLEYAGEAVTQLEHALQSMEMAREADCDEEMILAAFLHDIGHICISEGHIQAMEGYGVMHHEKLGGAWLKQRGFSSRLIQLVTAHVSAKRYLVATDPEYFNGLSVASRKTLEFQGGPMSPDEVAEFQNHPLFEEMILMRQFDEKAKEVQTTTPDWNYLKSLVVGQLA